MKRNVFNQYLSESNFRELFITEMGWNNPSGATLLPEYTLDERTFQIEQIAERSGFQILQCKVDEIPVSSVCKKLDTKLRKNAENYISIFVVPGTMHHLWVAPVKKVEKRDLVLVEYDTVDKASFLFEKMEGLSFSLDDEPPTILDIIEKVQAAFLINSEKITKDFYAGFKKEHTNFAKFITGIDDHLADKDNKNKQWYTSVMLNRLMFCYFIQKKGFLDGDVDYLRHKLEWTQENEGEDRFFNKFYKGFLVSLFHDGLNAPHHDQAFESVYGRIPYLNGGMFDVHQIEQDYAGLDIADEAFRSLFDFFDKWHWHLDDRMTATGRDINPDVLGYIFEQYINDRAQMGAYYTKEDITEYIGRNTIIPYLMDVVKQKDEKLFKANGELWQFLRDSGDRYIFDAVKKGHDLPIPEEIAVGIDTTQPNLLERRSHWNERTPDALALPTEIWRETIERLQRYRSIKAKTENGEITAINDFITYNLDIRQFAYDYLSHTQNHLFVEYFYDALQRVTILDPTCGSGAFLFAALNILEPLYEVCISRMQEFHEKNQHLFTRQLQEIQNKYRSNIQYFIYKSIILRNLYGVDIMVEATEIAKLRLFLKMVAVVDVDKRDPNLGLDPLPDIDFNIRCGNTLVGYATQKDLEAGIAYSDFFTAKEFRNKVMEEMEKVALTYEVFKTVQLTQAEDMAAFKRAKHDLKVRLATLNDLLNRQMYGSVSSTVNYDAWLSSHQPFHWLAEFYEIINDHGGFDVIIGNPPYVATKKIAYNCMFLNEEESKMPDIYSFCILRSISLVNDCKRFGMIVPLSITFSGDFIPLRKSIGKERCWLSSFDNIPASIFENVSQRCTILLTCHDVPMLNMTRLYRWRSSYRLYLTNTLYYSIIDNALLHDAYWPKIFAPSMNLLLKKLLPYAYSKTTNSICYVYFSTTARNYVSAFLECPPCIDTQTFATVSNSESGNYLLEVEDKTAAYAAMCGDFAFLYWLMIGDGFHVTKGNFSPLIGFVQNTDVSIKKLLARLGSLLNERCYEGLSFKKNAGKFVGSYNYMSLKDITRRVDTLLLSSLGLPKSEIINLFDWYVRILSINENMGEKAIPTKIKELYPPKCYDASKQRLLFDEIDKLLASHYGFTEEELDFIINYDIKYRMGDELNE